MGFRRLASVTADQSRLVGRVWPRLYDAGTLIEVVYGRHTVTDKLLARRGYAYNADVPVAVGDVVTVPVVVAYVEDGPDEVEAQESTVVRVGKDAKRYGYTGPVGSILAVIERAS